MTAATRSPSSPTSASRNQSGRGATPGSVNATNGLVVERIARSSFSQWRAPCRTLTSAPALARPAAARASAAGASGPNSTVTESSLSDIAAGRARDRALASSGGWTLAVTQSPSAGFHWPSPGITSRPAILPPTTGRSAGATTIGGDSGSTASSSTGANGLASPSAWTHAPPSRSPRA